VKVEEAWQVSVALSWNVVVLFVVTVHRKTLSVITASFGFSSVNEIVTGMSSGSTASNINSKVS